jgi:hypothetical protein
MIFDTGVFIALDNPADRRIALQLVRTMRGSDEMPVTNDAAVAQVWRDPARQVPLTMLLKATTIHQFGDARTIGQRCALSATGDVVDASLAVLADQLGQHLLTTDPADMSALGANYIEL